MPPRSARPTTSRASSGRRAGCRASTAPPSRSSGSRSPDSPSAGGRSRPRGSVPCRSRRRSITGCSARRSRACTGSSRCSATGSAMPCSSPRRYSARGSTCCSRRRPSTRVGSPTSCACSRRSPPRVEQAVANLERAGVATLARVAAADLHDIGARLERSVEALVPLTDAATAAALRAAQPGASAALERYRAWLAASADGLGPDVIVGREAFTWYLRHVALVTHDPEELVRAAMQDYRRSVVAEAATRSPLPRGARGAARGVGRRRVGR